MLVPLCRNRAPRSEPETARPRTDRRARPPCLLLASATPSARRHAAVEQSRSRRRGSSDLETLCRRRRRGGRWSCSPRRPVRLQACTADAHAHGQATGPATDRPMAEATARTPVMRSLNSAKVSDCAPSDRARAGSRMDLDQQAIRAGRDRRPRHGRHAVPHADAVGRVGEHRQVRGCFEHGMALMSMVLRVIVSKVRMPRSQRTTCRLPRAAMYSAAHQQLLERRARPRLSSTGRPAARPRASSSEKFCMLRAPIWSMSAPGPPWAELSTSITSVTIGRPVTARASREQLRPSSSALEAVGRGPRLEGAAAQDARALARTGSAVATICSSDSTERGFAGGHDDLLPANRRNRRPSPACRPASLRG